jgi:hypothetical protein
VKEWPDLDAVTEHLEHIRDPDFQGGQGPTKEEKREFRRKLGLDPVDKE